MVGSKVFNLRWVGSIGVARGGVHVHPQSRNKFFGLNLEVDVVNAPPPGKVRSQTFKRRGGCDWL